MRSTNFLGTSEELCVATAPHVCARGDGGGTRRNKTVITSVSSLIACNPRFRHLPFSHTIQRGLLSSCGILILYISRTCIERIFGGRLRSSNGRLGLSSTIGLLNYCGNLHGGVCHVIRSTPQSRSRRSSLPTRRPSRSALTFSPTPVEHTITFTKQVTSSGSVYNRVGIVISRVTIRRRNERDFLPYRVERISKAVGARRHGSLLN